MVQEGEESPTEAASLSPISISERLRQGAEYITPRTLTFTFFLTSSALSKAYLRGEKLALPFYVYSTGGMVVSGLYFSTAHILKSVRQKDDPFNYIVPAMIPPTIMFSVLSGYKKGLLAGVLGGAIGASYYFVGNWLYDTSRQTYIDSRKNLDLTSRYKKLVVLKPKFPKENRNVIDFGKIFSSNNTTSSGGGSSSNTNDTITYKGVNIEKVPFDQENQQQPK